MALNSNSPSGPLAAHVGLAPQWRTVSASTRRLVALSSTISTASPVRSTGIRTARSIDPRARSRRTSKKNVLPSPGSLSAHTRPPISSTNR